MMGAAPPFSPDCTRGFTQLRLSSGHDSGTGSGWVSDPLSAKTICRNRPSGCAHRRSIGIRIRSEHDHPSRDNLYAVLASEFIRDAARTRRIVLPVAVGKKTVLVSSRFQGEGCLPRSFLILFHRIRLGIPLIEIPCQGTLPGLRGRAFEFNYCYN